MLRLVILLLASCVCSRVYREYHLIDIPKTWDEAQAYCRENNMHLATIGNRDDLEKLLKMTEAIGWNKITWIGLKRGTEFSWKWSVGEPENRALYTNWAAAAGSGSCGSMAVDGKWLADTCDSKLGFICKEDLDKGIGMLVVSTEMSWREAREHCMQRGTDLAIVRNQIQNQGLRSMFNASKAFWMGLFRDEWQWSDRSDSSFRYWYITQPNGDGTCGSFSKIWDDRYCRNRYPFVCHTEKEVRKQTIVKVEIKSNSLNFNDLAVSEAILNQIQQKYGMVKLQWRIQPDGKIFHKKEKEEVK